MDVRLAQLDRAFGYGPKGRGFESSSARCMLNAERLMIAVFPLFCGQNRGILSSPLKSIFEYPLPFRLIAVPLLAGLSSPDPLLSKVFYIFCRIA